MLVLVGATGVGKTAVGTRVAGEIGGEIVNADSRQVYRGMNIGTSKPSTADFSSVPHHLFDIVEPDENFDVYTYNQLLRKTVCQIKSRSRIPILIGGSGQYVWSAVENWQFEMNEVDQGRRDEINQRFQVEGLQAMVNELQNLDSEAAKRIDTKNPRRVIRALERIASGSEPFISRKQSNCLNEGIFMVGLTLPRSRLYEVVDRRVEDMVRAGWMSEVKRLNQHGYGHTITSMGGIGYRELQAFMEKEIEWTDCLTRIRSRTHRLIRTQANWFKSEDSRIRWIDLSELSPEQTVYQICDQYFNNVGTST